MPQEGDSLKAEMAAQLRADWERARERRVVQPPAPEPQPEPEPEPEPAAEEAPVPGTERARHRRFRLFS